MLGFRALNPKDWQHGRVPEGSVVEVMVKLTASCKWCAAADVNERAAAGTTAYVLD